MAHVNRRRALQGAASGALLISSGAISSVTAADDGKAKLWTLEGELNVHAKYLYRYYLAFGDGQKCALFDARHATDVKELAVLKLPARVRVQGTFGSEFHAGGTPDNPSPFPSGWTLYMDVHAVEELK